MSDTALDLHSDTAPAERSATSARARLYLARGVLAVLWAIVFATVADSLTTGVGVLLVVYPMTDVIASLVDSPGSASRSLLRFNAVVSTVAAVGLAIAATGDVADVLRVFGAWAVLAGAAQFIVAIHRRGPTNGGQWPMLIAGGLSVLVGVYYNAVTAIDDPQLDPLVLYAAAGGTFFIVQGGLLALHTRKPST
jgi:hypothetical protein